MCGRYTLHADQRLFAEEFGLAEPVGVEPRWLEPRYNIAPSQPAAVVRAAPGEPRREVAMLRWGFVPQWAKDDQSGPRSINARSETVHTSRLFRGAFRHRRCLVACSGFYEWGPLDPGAKKPRKQPYHIRRRDQRVFGLGGIWETWRPAGGEEVSTFAILTTAANELLRPLHDRMPVIIAREDYARWLDPAIQEEERLRDLLVPAPPEAFEAFPVSTAVNRPSYDAPGCIAPLAVE